jgi:hypothetical protein
MAITKEQVLAMDLKSILAAVKDPSTSAEMQSLMGNRGSGVATHISKLMMEAQQREATVDAELSRVVPPSTEALAAEAQAMVAEPVAEVIVAPAVVAAPQFEAEDAEWKSVGITVVRDASGKPTRYIEEYQVTGEDGRPIGRPTHLEARTLPELAGKKREVHTQATRAFHRLKLQKMTFKQDKTILTPEEIAEAARQALESKDGSKAIDVIRQVIESEYQQREMTIKEKQFAEDGRVISNEFLRRHLHDFNPCDANKKMMGEYFAEHNLDFTLDNLEAAFVVLKEQGDKLAKVEADATVTVTVAANPVPVAAAAVSTSPVIPVVEPAAVVPASVVAQPEASVAPVVEATVSTPAAAPNVQPAARRPGVGGSIVPGSLSAQRPGTPEPALARKDFMKLVASMKPDVMKAKLKSDPQFVKQLEAYGIRVR